MKQCYVLIAVLMPFMATAQQPKPTPSPRLSDLGVGPPAEPVLLGTINPRILKLAVKSVLYRRLQDTVSGHPARVLRPGSFVVIPTGYSRWLEVRRARGPSKFSSDTATYYMPADAFKGGWITVVL